MFRILKSWPVAFLPLAIAATAANSAPVKIEFTAEVIQPDFGGNFGLGDTISGSIEYDSDLSLWRRIDVPGDPDTSATWNNDFRDPTVGTVSFNELGIEVPIEFIDVRNSALLRTNWIDEFRIGLGPQDGGIQSFSGSNIFFTFEIEPFVNRAPPPDITEGVLTDIGLDVSFDFEDLDQRVLAAGGLPAPDIQIFGSGPLGADFTSFEVTTVSADVPIPASLGFLVAAAGSLALLARRKTRNRS